MADGGDMPVTLAREVLVASMGLRGDEATAEARYRDALERATECREPAFAVVDHLAKYGICATLPPPAGSDSRRGERPVVFRLLSSHVKFYAH